MHYKNGREAQAALESGEILKGQVDDALAAQEARTAEVAGADK